jgi:hypothetical protein
LPGPRTESYPEGIASQLPEIVAVDASFPILGCDPRKGR